MSAEIRPIHNELMAAKHAKIFNTPVDHVGLGLTDYLEKVPRPMDLGTIKRNITLGFYTSPQQYMADVTLTFQNALLYNNYDSAVYFDAVVAWQKFDCLMLTRLNISNSANFDFDESDSRHFSFRSIQNLHARLGSRDEAALIHKTTHVDERERVRTARRMDWERIDELLKDSLIESKEQVRKGLD